MKSRVGRFCGCVLIVFLLASWMVAGCVGVVQQVEQPASVSPAVSAVGGSTMKLTSSAFAEGAMIPVKYTCNGQDISPPLAWADVPAGTRALALICDDPDAPAGTWVHWVAFNLLPDMAGLPEGVPAEKTPKVGGVQGTNSWRRIGYGGPCPPSGTHRYFFKLYALDNMLSLSSNATAKDVQAAMKGHVLAEAQLMGRYKR
jgi:Raf kinase inhibitor-like YbhB/YbcL family protein